MKKTIMLSLLTISFIHPSECYQAYSYSDNHQVSTMIQNKTYNENITISVTLHTRNLENNGSRYTLFWLEDGVLDKKKIDKNSIYAPFLIKTSSNKNEYFIKKIKSLTKDTQIEKQLIGIVDLFQYGKKNGIYKFKNSMGFVDINQSVKKNSITIKHIKQYAGNDQNIKYINSLTNITLDNNCIRWNTIKSAEKIKFSSSLVDTVVVDKREFILDKRKSKLDKNHWFYKLSTDISKWGFYKKKKKLSNTDALGMFENKEQEMKLLLKDAKGFENWVKENMDFLKYLDTMLESKELNDDVSKKLFAELGYIDSVDSTEILADVSLNENILNKERFRGLMGLKNTSAPIDDYIADEIANYGLSSQKDDDSLKKTIGMLVGTFARERMDRVPEQYERFTDSIIDAINTNENKTVSLTAAGNMLNTAPNRLVKTVDQMLLSTDQSSIKSEAAEALSRMGKSNLNISTFQKLIKNEKNQDASVQLIKASASAKDFKSNIDYKNQLINIADNRNKIRSNRIAALETLQKAGFGQTSNDKKAIREMMLNEQDSDISSLLKKLYRQ